LQSKAGDRNCIRNGAEFLSYEFDELIFETIFL